MNQATATVVAAVVALLGVLAGLLVGVSRWQESGAMPEPSTSPCAQRHDTAD